MAVEFWQILALTYGTLGWVVVLAYVFQLDIKFRLWRQRRRRRKNYKRR